MPFKTPGHGRSGFLGVARLQERQVAEERFEQQVMASHG
jgi:hypothetical protein